MQPTVDAVLSVHKLISEGKVPVHLLDFEMIDLNDEEEDGANDNNNDDGEKKEGEEEKN